MALKLIGRQTLLALVASCLLLACAQRGGSPPEGSATTSALSGWSSRDLPGKKSTQYDVVDRAGRACVRARANESASLWRRGMNQPAQAVSSLQFDWWIGSFSNAASVVDAATDDAPARLLLGFDGDVSTLSLRNRMQFDLVRTLTGESPPYALLMYVWDAHAPVDTLVTSTRSDRIRKIVVGSGPRNPAYQGWASFKRDLVADFTRAFGEAPGPLISMALMTDGDNTRSRSDACYGDILLFDARGQVLPGSLKM